MDGVNNKIPSEIQQQLLGPDVDFDIEQNAHSLLALDEFRCKEREHANNLIEEQNRLMNTLRHNRNEVQLESSLFEKKILLEKKSHEGVIAIANRTKQCYDNGVKHRSVAEKTLTKFEMTYNIIEKKYQAMQAEQSQYMQEAVETESTLRLLEERLAQLKNRKNSRQEKKRETLNEIFNKTSVHKAKGAEILQELYQNNCVAENVLPSEGATLVEIMMKLRSADRQITERNHYLKKAKHQKDSKNKFNSDCILAEKKETGKFDFLAEEINEKQTVLNEEFETARQEKEYLVNILNNNSNVLINNEEMFENKKNEYEHLVSDENAQFSEELTLKSKITEIQNIMTEDKNVRENEIHSIKESIAAVESNCLLLQGRIFEVTQQIEVMTSTLAEKTATYDKEEAELKMVEEHFNILNASDELESVQDANEQQKADKLLEENKSTEAQTLSEIEKQDAELKALQERLDDVSLQLAEQEKKQVLAEQEILDLGQSNENLRGDLKELADDETKCRNIESILEAYDDILKNGEASRVKLQKIDADQIKKMEELEEEMNTKMEEINEEIDNLKEESKNKKEEQIRLDQVIEFKRNQIEQVDAEILKLKDLQREFDSNLAKRNREKQQLDLIRKKKKSEEEVRKTVPKYQSQILKKKSVTKTEVKSKSVFDLTSRKPVLKQDEICLSGSESQKVLEAVVKVKEEKENTLPEPTPTGGKRFFKLRTSESKFTPIYGQGRYNKKPKIVPTDRKETVYDFDDDELQVVYDSKGKGKK